MRQEGHRPAVQKTNLTALSCGSTGSRSCPRCLGKCSCQPPLFSGVGSRPSSGLHHRGMAPRAWLPREEGARRLSWNQAGLNPRSAPRELGPGRVFLGFQYIFQGSPLQNGGIPFHSQHQHTRGRWASPLLGPSRDVSTFLPPTPSPRSPCRLPGRGWGGALPCPYIAWHPPHSGL